MRILAALIIVALAGVFGGGHALAQRPVGIDVSDYQGTGIDWTSVKNSGVSFAWTKATEGASGEYVSQASFTVNESNGKAAGVYMGAYHFAHPGQNTPAAEDSYFWSVAGGYITSDGLTFMPMLDMEVFTNSPIGASTWSQWVNDWCTDVVQDAANRGVSIRPFIYVSACNAGNFDSSVSQWFADIADYNGEDAQSGTPWSTCSGDDVWGGWNVWQYTDAAIEGDGDVYNGTLSGMVSTMVATVSTNSTIYYWDPQGTTGGNPYTGSMTGTWENSSWSYGPTGLASPVGWTDGKAACFGVHTGTNTPAYTVTMDANHVVAGFFDGPLTPNSCDITIQGTGVINLASGAQGLDAHNASDGSLAYLRINVPIAGDGQLFPEGNGQSFLNASNSYSGGTQLGYHDASGSNPFNGIVNFNNGSAFGTGTITLWNYGNGGAFVLTGSSAVTVPNAVTVSVATSNNIVGNSAGLTFSGAWTLNATLGIGSGGASGNLITISGAIGGSGGLIKYNPGILALAGANTYTGVNNFQAGTVRVSADNNLGAAPGSKVANSITLSNVILNVTSGFALNSNRGITLVANPTISVNSGQTLSYGGILAGSGFGITKSTAGTLMLSGASTYTGATAVTGGTLALTNGGSIGASAVTVSSGATLANASTSTRTMGGATTLNSGALALFTTIGAGTLGKISVTGNLTLNNNAITVNMNGAPLAAGTYRLMDCTGTLSGTANATPTISGTPLTAGLTASVSTTAGSAGHFDLVISKSTPTFSNLAANPAMIYGTPTITLSGTVAATGPVYPVMGEPVTVTINGNAQFVLTSDATGDFSINYNLTNLPLAGSPYTITYSYPGDSVLNGATNTSTALTVNPLPVVLTGTRAYDGTNDAPASILTVANKVGGDAVTVASGSGTLASANVGTNAITLFGTLALGGAAAGNYTLAGATGSVVITATTFSITSATIDSTGTNLVITWQSTPGTSYHLIGSTNMTAALSTWTNVSSPIVASDTSTTITNPIVSSLNFFSVASP